MSRLGCKRSPKDERDYQYRVKLKAVLPPVLPPSIDFTMKMTSVKDQKNEGACVGFASVAMKEFQERRQGWCCPPDFSERYVYEMAKMIDGDPLPHEGTTIRAAMDVLRKHGVCKESCWKYSANIPMHPCIRAEAQAKANRIMNYVAIEDVLAMQQALVSNGPFVIGIDVFTSFDRQVDGVIPMPNMYDILEGGHAICIVGYNNESRQFKFKNSWGKNWGDGGYGYLPYPYMTQFAYDGWLATDLP